MAMSARRTAIAVNGHFVKGSPWRSEHLRSFTMTISSCDRNRITSRIEAAGRVRVMAHCQSPPNSGATVLGNLTPKAFADQAQPARRVAEPLDQGCGGRANLCQT